MKKHPKKAEKVERAESRAVLAIRIPLSMRDRLRAAAGWGQQQSFVHDAIMHAIEKAEHGSK